MGLQFEIIFYSGYSKYHHQVAEKQQRFSVFTESALVKMTVRSHVVVHTGLFFSREKKELLVRSAFKVPREAL